MNGREVSEADFDAWYEANMTNDVTWYSPGRHCDPGEYVTLNEYL